MSSEAIALLKQIKDIGDNVDYNKLFFAGGKKSYGLMNFSTLEKLVKHIYNWDLSIDEGQIKQNEFAEWLDERKACPARGSKYIDLKESASKKVKKNYDGWEKIVNEFTNKILPLLKKDGVKNDSGDQQPDILDTPEDTRFNDFLEQIREKQKSIDMKLSNEYFPYKTPDTLLLNFHELKSKIDNKNTEEMIGSLFERFGNKGKVMPEGVKKKEGKKYCRLLLRFLSLI